jgi:hypothetical protein
MFAQVALSVYASGRIAAAMAAVLAAAARETV